MSPRFGGRTENTMKVLLLAAGRGTRISRYLGGNPKCTVDIGGEKLIHYTIRMLHEKEIDDIAIVLGYKGSKIQDVLKDFPFVKYYTNPFYDVTNSIASAWFARDFLKDTDDTLIMNADVFLDSVLMDRIISVSESPVMFADSSRKEEADYKFKFTNGILEAYGKELTGDDISGEYVGIGRFSSSFMNDFIAELDRLIGTQTHNVWWENVVYSLSEKMPVKVIDISGMFWAEVDYIEDYNRILDHVSEQKN